MTHCPQLTLILICHCTYYLFVILLDECDSGVFCYNRPRLKINILVYQLVGFYKVSQVIIITFCEIIFQFFIQIYVSTEVRLGYEHSSHEQFVCAVCISAYFELDRVSYNFPGRFVSVNISTIGWSYNWPLYIVATSIILRKR